MRLQIPVLFIAVLAAACQPPSGVEILPSESATAKAKAKADAVAKAATPGVNDPPDEAPAVGEGRKRTVYVPAYSHLPAGYQGVRDRLMSIHLSVRNIDVSTEVVLTHVDYFDTSGHRVRRYLDKPKTLRPLETIDFDVSTDDKAGGSGANFLIYWEGPTDAHPLLTETIMVHRDGTGMVAFTSRGVELDRRPSPTVIAPSLAPTNESGDGDKASPRTAP